MLDLGLKGRTVGSFRGRRIAALAAPLLSAGALLCATYANAAQSPAEFFRGKVLTVIVPYGAAGGFEYWAAALKPYLQKKLGVQRIDLVNKTGGGGLVGANYMYHAKPDGLTIGVAPGTGGLFAQLINKPGVAFDMRKFSWIGSANVETTVTVAGASSPYKSFANLMKLRGGTKKVTGLSAGYGGSDYVGTTLPLTTFGIPYRMLLAYQGSSAAKAGILRGDGDIASYGYSVFSPVIKSGNVKALFVSAVKPLAALPKVPTILALGKKYKLPANKMALLNAFVRAVNLGKDFAAPPGVPADRLAFMRAAFKSAATNPNFVKGAAKVGRVAGYSSPEQLQAAINAVFTKKASFMPFLKK